jgi:hypothetical protein
VRGAIVSFDTPVVPASWRWAGPRWIEGPPADIGTVSIAGLHVRVLDPDAARQRWHDLFGPQPVVFATANGPDHEGIDAVELDGFDGETTICGVTFRGRTC